MYGLTRGTMTLIGAAVAGFLVWLSTQIVGTSVGEYWSIVGLLAAAGFVVALSQLLGGWTKWGWPRLSGSVFLIGFLPVLIVVGWLVLAYQPDPNWFQRRVENWSDDLGLVGLIRDLRGALAVSVFALGLFLGLTLDTTGPRTEPLLRRRRRGDDVPGDHPLAAGATTARDDEPTRVEAGRSEDETVVRDADDEPTSVTRTERGEDRTETTQPTHPLAADAPDRDVDEGHRNAEPERDRR